MQKHIASVTYCFAHPGNNLNVPMVRLPDMDTVIETTDRLGRLLRSYRRAG